MRKIILVILALFALMLVAGCGTSGSNSSKAVKASSSLPATVSDVQGKKVLVAYFSRPGDNYGVGNIEVGNTHIMANMIAKEIGADTFEIATVNPYPKYYKDCNEVAKAEQKDNARPKLAKQVPNMKDYDIIFVGYPIWWNDLPMPVYTFLESYDFKGKNIIPFCTSAGDMMTGKEKDISKHAKGATVYQGLGLEGKIVQEQPDSVRPKIHEWLVKLGFIK